MSSDQDLVRRMLGGDEAAFEALAARYGPAVRRRLLAIVRVEATADDLLQEVLLRLWTRGGQWQGKGSLAAWLLRTATNLALNQVRTVRRRRSRPLPA